MSDGRETVPDGRQREREAALQHPVRHRVVHYVLEREGSVPMTLLINEVARLVAEFEQTCPRDWQLDRVRTSLVEHHLPALHAVGLVEYRPEADQVALTDDHAEATRLLGRVRPGPWSEERAE